MSNPNIDPADHLILTMRRATAQGADEHAAAETALLAIGYPRLVDQVETLTGQLAELQASVARTAALRSAA